MAVELNPLPSNSVNNIDSNFERVVIALQDAVSRSGNAPNDLNADLDMNSNDILNVNSLDVEVLTVGGVDILNNTNIIEVIDMKDSIDEIVSIKDEIDIVANSSSDIAIVANNIEDVNNFSDVYLGAKDEEPTTRNDGSPLVVGDMYFDRTEGELRVWTGSDWSTPSEQGLSLNSKSFVADGVANLYTLDEAPFSANNVMVWVGGVRQRPNVDYSVNEDQLLLVNVPSAGTSIDSMTFVKVLPIDIGVPSDNTVTAAKISDSPTEQTAIRNKIGAYGSDSTIPITSGGTGAVNASDARTNLGVAIGSNVQAYNAKLAAIAALTGANGSILRFTGANTVVMQPIVGTVSQASGVPTGAIIEQGSNANGNYIKYADGTQICWATRTAGASLNIAAGSIYRSDSNTWTYPASFTATPSISGCQVGSPGYSWFGEGGGVATASTCSWAMFAGTANASIPTASIIAIGRWF